MKLYYYEHCPFSARVRMVLNLKRIEADREVLPADDERTIANLIGKHQIPVMVTDDGEPMKESMEIVHYLDRLDGSPLIDEQDNQSLDAWLEPIVPTLQYLGYPRWTLIQLAEFATPAAYEHFRAKKTHTIGDFAEAVANTPAKVLEVNASLQQLPDRADLDAGRDRIRTDDFKLYPILRGFTVVKALEWPTSVQNYVQQMGERTGLDNFFDRAL